MTEHRDDSRGDLRVGGWLPYPPDRAQDAVDGDDAAGEPPAYQPPRAYGWPGDQDAPRDEPLARDEPPGDADLPEGPPYPGPWQPDDPDGPPYAAAWEPTVPAAGTFDAFGIAGTRGADTDPRYVPPAERTTPGGHAEDRAAGPGGSDGERPTEPLVIPMQRAVADDQVAAAETPGRHYDGLSDSSRAPADGLAGAAAAGAATRTGGPAVPTDTAPLGHTGGPAVPTDTAPLGHTGGTVARPGAPAGRRRSTPGANDITQQLRMIPAAIADLPPVTLRGLPMFLAAVMALGAIAILVTLNLPSGKPAAPVSRVTSTPTLGMPTIAPVLPPMPTGTPAARPTTAATATTTRTTTRRTTSPAPARVLLGALGVTEMSGYCQSQQSGGARLTQPAQGPNAAIDNWVCTGEKRNKGFTIVPTSVCRWKYGSTAYAAYLDINDAYSWRCYR